MGTRNTSRKERRGMGMRRRGDRSREKRMEDKERMS